MKMRIRFLAAFSFISTGLAACIPLSAGAEAGAPLAFAAVVISEVQTGNAARADEFIELHNTTGTPLDLTGWQLRYVTASPDSVKNLENPTALLRLAPPLVDGRPALVPAKGYYLLRSGAVSAPEGIIGQQYEGLLPATGGSLILLSPDNTTCHLRVEDALAWGGTAHLFGEGEALLPGSGSADDRLNQRFARADGTYADTGVNAADFLALAAAVLPYGGSPGAANTQLLPDLATPRDGVLSQALPKSIKNPECALPPPPASGPQTPAVPPAPAPQESPPSVSEPSPSEPGPTIPAGNTGLKAPLLSELLPNPAPPGTDKDDEFIELYNANDVRFDLSGYLIEVGTKTKRRFTIPADIGIEPGAFLAFSSADTGLALSNAGSQVSLADPLGRVLIGSEAYGAAKPGQAWVLADGKWQWTVRPTPNDLNVISAPPVKKTAKKSTVRTLTAVQTTGIKSDSTGPGPTAAGGQKETAGAIASSPLHPAVLALIAGSALLYGAYEYRHDLANKFHQFRSNRAARRAARQGVEGR